MNDAGRAATVPPLPESLHFIQRDWLSSNNLLCFEGENATLVDSGYVAVVDQTVALVNVGLQQHTRELVPATRGSVRLTRLINTHSHSDHIGGNAAVKRAFNCEILIPATMESMVAAWDEEAMLLGVAGQRAERFTYDGVIAVHSRFEMGGLIWQAFPAPGHDMSALVFYCAEEGLLISGDALWEDGFGILFSAFSDVPTAAADVLAVTRTTLEMISRLDLATVIPGHGPVFGDPEAALARAFGRLDAFTRDPLRLGRNAVKAGFTFNLLDMGRLEAAALPSYLASIPFFRDINRRNYGMSNTDFAAWLLREIIGSRAARVEDGWIIPSGKA
ncbi:MAG: MBL fold metallo-hydrolase [Rhodocyclaceae bacterium]|nr:MBL fold metallo-hydrolase [Rhodocyclaceae bacterium]